jgi:hypothetical protein
MKSFFTGCGPLQLEAREMLGGHMGSANARVMNTAI